MGRLPTLPEYRIGVASVILAIWVIFHLIDAFTKAGVTTPFIDATCGAVVAWLFGGTMLKRGDDE